MTSGVLVCIKNKTAAFLKKKKSHFTFMDISGVCLEFVWRNHVKAEQQRHAFLPCSLPLTCLPPKERTAGEVGL